MGSSFHWTDAPRAVEEFRRILKPGGFFTAVWNPRDIKRSQVHTEIEEMIYKEVPDLKRVSSGSTITTEYIANNTGGGSARRFFWSAPMTNKCQRSGISTYGVL